MTTLMYRHKPTIAEVQCLDYFIKKALKVRNDACRARLLPDLVERWSNEALKYDCDLDAFMHDLCELV